MPGLALVAGTLLVGSLAGQIGGPLGDTVDDKIWRYVHAGGRYAELFTLQARAYR